MAMREYLLIDWWKFKIPQSFKKYEGKNLTIGNLFVSQITADELVEFIKSQEHPEFTEEQFCLLFEGLLDEVFRLRLFNEEEKIKIYASLTYLITDIIDKYYSNKVAKGRAFGDYSFKLLYCYEKLFKIEQFKNLNRDKLNELFYYYRNHSKNTDFLKSLSSKYKIEID